MCLLHGAGRGGRDVCYRDEPQIWEVLMVNGPLFESSDDT